MRSVDFINFTFIYGRVTLELRGARCELRGLLELCRLWPGNIQGFSLYLQQRYLAGILSIFCISNPSMLSQYSGVRGQLSPLDTGLLQVPAQHGPAP